MNTTQATPHGQARTAARLSGILYITGTLAGILSLAATGPIREAQDLFLYVADHQNQIVIGAVFVLVMGLALAMVPVVLFPVLRKYDEVLALGYVVFRGGLEAVTYLALAATWLMLVPLSQAYVRSGPAEASSYQALGAWFLDPGEISSMTAIVFCLGALMFYTLLYRSRLVPRWLSGWGLAAILPYLAAGLLVLFGILDPLSLAAVTLNLPLAIQEMVLAGWLIVKGFQSSSADFGLLRGAVRQV
jgi:hypothetical protein